MSIQSTGAYNSSKCEMSAPGAYDIDIEADDIDVTDTVTVVWDNSLGLRKSMVLCLMKRGNRGIILLLIDFDNRRLILWNE